jgi:glycosyltransferase involved in cell wall biosynthesis
MPEFSSGKSEVPTWDSIRHFAREMAFLAPGIVLPYTILPNILCGLVWRKAGADLCAWGQRDAGIDLAHSAWQSLAIDRTPVFVANSWAGFRHLRETWSVPAERLVRIPNAVCLAPQLQSREAWRRRIGASDQDFVAGMLGNIQPLKDHDTLFRAWREVVQATASRKAILCLAGQQTASAKALEARAHELDIQDSIRWLGHVADVSGFLSAMDLAVFSSVREGLPNGILEPMAAKLAIVATDIEGAREALPPEQYAYLAHPGDPVDFAGKIIHLMEAPELRHELGRGNGAYATSHFSSERMGAAYVELFARHV